MTMQEAIDHATHMVSQLPGACKDAEALQALLNAAIQQACRTINGCPANATYGAHGWLHKRIPHNRQVKRTCAACGRIEVANEDDFEDGSVVAQKCWRLIAPRLAASSPGLAVNEEAEINETDRNPLGSLWSIPQSIRRDARRLEGEAKELISQARDWREIADCLEKVTPIPAGPAWDLLCIKARQSK